MNSTSRSAAGASEKFSAVYQVLSDAIDAHAFPGCAFGAVRDGEVIIEGALGRFTYDADSLAMQPDTVFDVASLTKVVSTTAAAMLLHQRGLLDVETPLGELLPGFVVGRAPGECARHVTLRHLLAHSSGLPGYVEFFRTSSTPSKLYRSLLELSLEAVPGVRAEYSDPGFILLGKALEVLTGEYLSSWASREVFAPLGMTATCFCPAGATRAAIPPTEEDTTLRHRRIQGEVQDEHAWLLKGAAGHAGLFSNVPDLLRFADEVLHAGQPGRLFTRETVEFFAQRQGPPESSRALGWDTPSEGSSSGRHFSARSIGHLGYSGCSLWIDLEADRAVVLLTNRTWPDRSEASKQLIRDVRPSFHDSLLQAL